MQVASNRRRHSVSFHGECLPNIIMGSGRYQQRGRDQAWKSLRPGLFLNRRERGANRRETVGYAWSRNLDNIS